MDRADRARRSAIELAAKQVDSPGMHAFSALLAVDDDDKQRQQQLALSVDDCVSQASASLLLAELCDDRASPETVTERWLDLRGHAQAAQHAAHWERWHTLPSACEEIKEQNAAVLAELAAAEVPPASPRLRYAGLGESDTAVADAFAAAPASLCGGTLIDHVGGGEGMLLTLRDYSEADESYVAEYDDGSLATLSHEDVRRLLRMRFLVEEAE